jgi:hypothetical protein
MMRFTLKVAELNINEKWLCFGYYVDNLRCTDRVEEDVEHQQEFQRRNQRLLRSTYRHTRLGMIVLLLRQ